MFRSFQSALHERFVDDRLCRDVRQFTSLPGFDLLSHGLEVALICCAHFNRELTEVQGS